MISSCRSPDRWDLEKCDLIGADSIGPIPPVYAPDLRLKRPWLLNSFHISRELAIAASGQRATSASA